MGFLARPVTADDAGYGAGYDEYADDDEDDLHHASVPCMLPSMTLMATAVMNNAASMYTKSI